MSDEIRREWLAEELEQVGYAIEELTPFLNEPLHADLPGLQQMVREKVDNSVDFLRRYGVERLDNDQDLQRRCRTAYNYVEGLYEQWAFEMDHLFPLMKREDFERLNSWICSLYDDAQPLSEVGRS